MRWYNLSLIMPAQLGFYSLVFYIYRKKKKKSLSKNLKLRLQAMQNKCMRFCLQLDKMSRICAKEFIELNWLNVHDRYLQLIVSDIFKFNINQCPNYFNEVFCPVDKNGVATHSCNRKLKLPFCKLKLWM